MEQHGKCALYLVNGQTQWEENLLSRTRFFSALVLHTEQKTLFCHYCKFNRLLLHENIFFFFFCPNSFNALHHHCTDDAQNWNVFQKEITFKHSDDILEQTTVPPNPVFSSKPVSDATEQRPKL